MKSMSTLVLAQRVKDLQKWRVKTNSSLLSLQSGFFAWNQHNFKTKLLLSKDLLKVYHSIIQTLQV